MQPNVTWIFNAENRIDSHEILETDIQFRKLVRIHSRTHEQRVCVCFVLGSWKFDNRGMLICVWWCTCTPRLTNDRHRVLNWTQSYTDLNHRIRSTTANICVLDNVIALSRRFCILGGAEICLCYGRAREPHMWHRQCLASENADTRAARDAMWRLFCTSVFILKYVFHNFSVSNLQHFR